MTWAGGVTAIERTIKEHVSNLVARRKRVRCIVAIDGRFDYQDRVLPSGQGELMLIMSRASIGSWQRSVWYGKHVDGSRVVVLEVQAQHIGGKKINSVFIYVIELRSNNRNVARVAGEVEGNLIAFIHEHEPEVLILCTMQIVLCRHSRHIIRYFGSQPLSYLLLGIASENVDHNRRRRTPVGHDG